MRLQKEVPRQMPPLSKAARSREMRSESGRIRSRSGTGSKLELAFLGEGSWSWVQGLLFSAAHNCPGGGRLRRKVPGSLQALMRGQGIHRYMAVALMASQKHPSTQLFVRSPARQEANSSHLQLCQLLQHHVCPVQGPKCAPCSGELCLGPCLS